MEIAFELDESGNRIGISMGPVVAQRPDDSPIVGERVRLERLSVEHSPDLWEAFSATQSTTLWTYMPQGPFDSESAQREWIRSVADSADPLFYAIVDAATERAVGVASYLRIDPTNGVIEVGYLSFSGALQRTPAATEAMYLMARNAFDRGFRRYEWKCNVLNAPSISAAERLGFSFEGVFRNAWYVKGHNRDTAWFGMTVEDRQLCLFESKRGPGQSLCVTADHGMLDVTDRLWIEDRPSLMRDVRFITGEPRMRHVFAQQGYEGSLLRSWQQLSDVAEIFSREEFIASQLLGDVEEHVAARIGDVVAVSLGQSVLASRSVDERVSNLAGNHGGRTETERLIPCAVLAG